MPLQAGDIVMIQSFARTYQQRIMLTRTYTVAQVTSGGDINVQLAAILTAWRSPGGPNPAYMALMPEPYIQDFIRAQVVYPIRSAFVDQTTGLGGEWTGDEALNQSAAALTLRTNKAGRNQRATVHIGPVPAAVLLSGTVSAGYVTAMNLFGSKLIQNIVTTGTGAATLTPVIYHRGGDGPQQKQDVITGYSSHDELRTMRRRVLGRGI